jgi:hypothetical protein
VRDRAPTRPVAAESFWRKKVTHFSVRGLCESRSGSGSSEGPNILDLILPPRCRSPRLCWPPTRQRQQPSATGCFTRRNLSRTSTLPASQKPSVSIAPVVRRVASPRMATAAAALRYFPNSLRNRDYPGTNSTVDFVTPSSRRRHCAAAVAVLSQEAEPSSSLGHLTRADFPILHQVSTLSLPVSL